MSKVLKRYDETTGEWIIVSAPDVSVVQQIEDGSDISDTNVIVTNYNYIDGEGRKTCVQQCTINKKSCKWIAFYVLAPEQSIIIIKLQKKPSK